MSAALYSRDILRLAVSIPHQQRLENPDGTAEARSRACGSRVLADVAVSAEGRITSLGIEINACALGQASAAILGNEAIGKAVDEIVGVRAHLADFLAGSAGHPGDWKNMNHLEAARSHAGRHAAILLPYDALIAALESAATKHKAA
mgnify:CR=1 FL=1